MAYEGEYKVENKTRFITPVLMLIGAAVASITMFVKNYELYTMLWVLLVVLIIFYIIGDVVRYIYASVRPCILPQSSDLENMIAKMNVEEEQSDEVVEKNEEETEDAGDAGDAFAQAVEEEDDVEYSRESEEYDGYNASYEDLDEEYTDEKLDEM